MRRKKKGKVVSCYSNEIMVNTNMGYYDGTTWNATRFEAQAYEFHNLDDKGIEES